MMVERNSPSLQPGEIISVSSNNPLSSDEPASSKKPASLETSTRDEPDTTANTGCFRSILWNLRKGFFNDYIPDNLYATDFKLLFILTAIYTSLIFQFRQTGNEEAADDADSGRLFKINSVWTNHSISGGVSDRVLWNCRIDSETDAYYKTLYLGLIILYCMVVVVYIIASVIINTMVAFAVSKVKIHKEDDLGIHPYYLDTVADDIKIIHQLREMLKVLKYRWFKAKNMEELEREIRHSKKITEKLLRFKTERHFENWLTVLYIIPRIETIVMLSILTLALTSYDIHPIGCLSHIGVSYNETESSVELMFSDNVKRYQKLSLLLIPILLLIWLLLKLIQFSLLPRSKWGLRIEKLDKRKYCSCAFKITTQSKSDNDEQTNV